MDDLEGLPEVDLHGLRPEQAQRRLQQELHTARLRGHRALLVICGRGWGNREQKPILRGKLEAWLRGAAAAQAGVRGHQVVAKGGALLVKLG